MTAKTEDVIRRTQPTVLIPGSNLIGLASVAVMQQFTAPGLSAFGLFDVWRFRKVYICVLTFDWQAFESYLLAQIGHVWPDPRASGDSPSEIIPKGPSIGTLRISLQDAQAEFRILQEYRERSILRGLASVGGLWTFIGGVFSALFGSSLMRLFFGLCFSPLNNFLEMNVILQEVNVYQSTGSHMLSKRTT